MIERLKHIMLIFLIAWTSVLAQGNTSSTVPLELSDSAFVSVLTSTPHFSEVYTVFGHSAMRVCDLQNGIDIVFNYGIFYFNSPNFIYRFTAGKTDYWVSTIAYSRYLDHYDEIREQKINLTPTEVQKIWTFLIENVKPENSVYRYNIFFNNCTTKLADILEENVDGVVAYPNNEDNKTFRDLLHEHLKDIPWLEFGIDLVIGSDADRIMTSKEKIFLPIYEYKTFNESYIERENKQINSLVVSDDIVVQTEKIEESEKIFFTPLLVGIIVLIISLVLSVYSYRKQFGLSKIFNFTLFLTGGLAGCILFFLMFFSVHPATSPNWNIVWLNPLQLIFAFAFFFNKTPKCAYYYHFVNFVGLSLFLLAWILIPQQMDLAFIPFILSFMIVSGVTILRYRKYNKHKI